MSSPVICLNSIVVSPENEHLIGLSWCLVKDGVEGVCLLAAGLSRPLPDRLPNPFRDVKWALI